RIRQAMADTPIELDDGQLLEVTISIGGVSIDRAGMDAPAQQWIEQADNNLYAAKRGGRNRVVITPFQWADTTDGH
ncbi:MAG TPA: diguanylate cyclase, partial [Sulfurivirga caldicuralii]|nr:diguanylate cyclase [Sulfurivirga caldicuralii]